LPRRSRSVRRADLETQLAQTWAPPRGWTGRLSAADHKTIGIRYLVTGFGFFCFAGLLAMLIGRNWPGRKTRS
jgi:cytochrome c oxidase subunit I+III